VTDNGHLRATSNPRSWPPRSTTTATMSYRSASTPPARQPRRRARTDRLRYRRSARRRPAPPTAAGGADQVGASPRTRPRQPPGGRPSGCCTTAPTSALHAALSSAVPTPIRSDTAPGMRPSPPCLRLSTHTSLPPASHPRPADSAIRARSAWYRPGERSAPPRLPEAGADAGSLPRGRCRSGRCCPPHPSKIHEPRVTGVSPRPRTGDSARKLRNTRRPVGQPNSHPDDADG